jgi:phosphate:Na+ symporter
MITAPGAIGVILGANVGTCVTAMLAGVNTNKTARRLALFHLIFNLFGVVLFIPFLGVFGQFIISLDSDPGRQIALAHTIFNVVSTMLILPWMRPLEQILKPKSGDK